MIKTDLPKVFEEFEDARKQGFLAAKEFKENGGKLVGYLCSYTPPALMQGRMYASQNSSTTCSMYNL